METSVKDSAWMERKDNLASNIRNFATNQRARAARYNKIKADQEAKIAELKKFAENFKLPTPVPKDLMAMVEIDERRERVRREVEQILEWNYGAAKDKMEQSAAKPTKEYPSKLAELKKPSQYFKLTTPMPTDLQVTLNIPERKSAGHGALIPPSGGNPLVQTPSSATEIDPRQDQRRGQLWTGLFEGGASPRESDVLVPIGGAGSPSRASPNHLSNHHLTADLVGSELNKPSAPSQEGRQAVPGSVMPPSSNFPSLPSVFTRGTRETKTTTPTSISAHSTSQHTGKPAKLGLVSMEVVREENEQATVHSQVSAEPPAAEGFGDDDASFISQGSTYYTPEQRDDVITRFSRVISKGLQINFNYYAASDSSRQHVLSHLRSALKTFTEVAETPTKDQAKAMKMVRRLRPEIARKLQDSVLEIAHGTEAQRTAINLGQHSKQMKFSDKISWWRETNPALIHEGYVAPVAYHEQQAQSERNVKSESTFSFPAIDSKTGSSELDMMEDDTVGVYGKYIDPEDILKQFTEQPAFHTLIGTTGQLFDRYHGQKMDLIRHRASLALRRFSARSEQLSTNVLQAAFKIEWNLKDFLRTNYDAGIHQNLDQILAVTGLTDNARLCSVGEYFRWCWPRHQVQLLQALEKTLVAEIGRPFHRLSRSSVQGSVVVDSTLTFLIAAGDEEFIIAIAQQISWLAAVCQEKQDYLTYAYVGFSEASGFGTFSGPTFDIDVRLEDFSVPDCRSCWNRIVGPAVLITGFPIPERKNEERGLEVSIPVMAALAGIPQAVTFGGGVVFKGRCHALVPTVDFGSSIQWHLLDTYPARLEWADIDKACPTRLLGQRINKAFWSRRSFLGWCPRILELLGTAGYDYLAVQYSRAGQPSKSAQIDKLTIGFSQWGTLTADITFGKHDGFQCQRLEDYDLLLDDAKNTHIILHDTSHKRAFQTNAEDLILHVLHHRRKQNKSRIEPPLGPVNVEDLLFVDPDRRITSTGEVMVRNAERVFSVRRQFSSSKPKQSLFKDEVKLLWTTIDGLWASSYGGDGSKSPLKLNLDLGQTVSGWEYMDIVNNTRCIEPKSVNLRRTCGRWNQYAKDIKAVVLFAGELGDVFIPAVPGVLCSAFASLPRDECYLTIRVDTLTNLFTRQGSLQDQKKLTDSGLVLQGPGQLFKPCDVGRHTLDKSCSALHIARLVNRSAFRKEYTPIPLVGNQDGAIIVGETKGSLFSNIFHEQSNQMDKRELRKSARQGRRASYHAHQRATSTLVSTPAMENSHLPIAIGQVLRPTDPTGSNLEAKSSIKSYRSPRSNYGDSSLSSATSSTRWSGISSRTQTISSLTSVSSNGTESSRGPPRPAQPPARTWSRVAASGTSPISSGNSQNESRGHRVLNFKMEKHAQPMGVSRPQ